MAYRFGKAFIDITANSSPLKRSLALTASLMRGFVGFGTGIMKGLFSNVLSILGKVVDKLKQIVKWAGLAAVAIVGLSVRAAIKQEEAEVKLAAALKATGNATGFTLNQLKQYATQLQRVSRHGDEALLPILAMLATFKELRGPEFKRAMQAILDMSAVMDQDLRQSAIQVGKALNDPLIGFTALRRIGVSFTADAEKLIKKFVELGDTVSAQRIILKELEGQFKGAEEAMSRTAGGGLKRLKNAFGDLLEVFAKPLIIPLNEQLQKWITLLQSPAMQNAVFRFGLRFKVVLGIIKNIFIDLFNFLKDDWLVGLEFIRTALVEIFTVAGRAIGEVLFAGFMAGMDKIKKEFGKFIDDFGEFLFRFAGVPAPAAQAAVLRAAMGDGKDIDRFAVAGENIVKILSESIKKLAGLAPELSAALSTTWAEGMKELEAVNDKNIADTIDAAGDLLGEAPPRSGSASEKEKRKAKAQFIGLDAFYRRLAEQTAGNDNIQRQQLMQAKTMVSEIQRLRKENTRSSNEMAHFFEQLIAKNSVGRLGPP